MHAVITIAINNKNNVDDDDDDNNSAFKCIWKIAAVEILYNGIRKQYIFGNSCMKYWKS